ncbi:hypothetical protein N7495_008067 [Penicillium taxi]|uniref:uncharacterized protein n=1 Tax=Penicillium taxi TaxID=168475 RepID=UPI0025450C3A|nr:uncharacterized protein N7495_008067 [Penicillium taxi]KAJ5888026.1 hypothetical protein N7495_008067 [Penicillium taxi]
MSQELQYWLPGWGLSRHIVLGHIHYFLGPSASVRPYSYQIPSKGREGYMIVGVPLTREQIEDLAAMSREYEEHEAVRMSQNGSLDGSRLLSEPYINQLILVDRSRSRRRPESDSRER